jgi:hypothetical protein
MISLSPSFFADISVTAFDADTGTGKNMLDVRIRDAVIIDIALTGIAPDFLFIHIPPSF